MYVNARAIIERSTLKGVEILVQQRFKPYEGGGSIELPGGQLEEYESFIAALRREIREETGLELSEIGGLAARLETQGASANVECLAPFAIYQTLHGPVDSLGAYFRCQASGQLLEAGDETRALRWLPVTELSAMLSENPDQFSWVDRAGLSFYLRSCP